MSVYRCECGNDRSFHIHYYDCERQFTFFIDDDTIIIQVPGNVEMKCLVCGSIRLLEKNIEEYLNDTIGGDRYNRYIISDMKFVNDDLVPIDTDALDILDGIRREDVIDQRRHDDEIFGDLFDRRYLYEQVLENIDELESIFRDGARQYIENRLKELEGANI